MQLLQVGNDAVRIRGGIPQAISDVGTALAGSVVSFTDPALVADGVDGAMHVPHAASLAGRLYGWAAPAQRRAAEAAFDRCDVVMIHGMFRYHYQWAVQLARRKRRPFFVMPHGALDPHVLSHGALPKRLWWAALGRRAARHAAGLIFTARRERDKAQDSVPAGVPSHVVNLPVGIPAEAPVSAREDTRRRFGIAPTDRVALFLGRLHAYKRVPTLIAAFNRAAPPDTHLLIAGPDGPSLTREACARLVAPAVRARVHFPGAVFGEDKRALFAAADAFVSVSARENFGYALCEALAAGLPVIAGPGHDLLAEPAAGRCGWLLDRDETPDVAAALTRFATTPQAELHARGQAGRLWVRENLGFERFRQDLRRICAGTAA